MRFLGYQTRFLAQHVLTHLMVNGIHCTFFRIGVGNVIGSFIITPYLCFYRNILRESKSAIFAGHHIELFTRCIEIRTSHDTLQVRATA